MVSISEMLYELKGVIDNIDSSTKVLGTIFIVLFIILNKGLSKIFKEDRTKAGIGAFVISFLFVYLLNMTGANIGFAFDYLGYDQGLASLIITIIVIIGLIYIIRKIGLSNILLISGAGLLAVSLFTDWIYQSGFTTVIGIILILLGLWLWRRKKKKQRLRMERQFSRPGMFRRAWGRRPKPNWRGVYQNRKLNRASRQMKKEQDRKWKRQQEQKAGEETGDREKAEEAEQKKRDEELKRASERMKKEQEEKFKREQEKQGKEEMKREREERQKKFAEENRKKAEKAQREAKEKIRKYTEAQTKKQ